MTKTRKWAYLLIAHGTRGKEEKAAFFKFVDEFRKAFPNRFVQPALFGRAHPSLPEGIDRCVAEGAEEIFVVLLISFPKRYLKRDIPAQIQEAKQRHPHVDFHSLAVLTQVSREEKGLPSRNSLNSSSARLPSSGSGFRRLEESLEGGLTSPRGGYIIPPFN